MTDIHTLSLLAALVIVLFVPLLLLANETLQHNLERAAHAPTPTRHRLDRPGRHRPAYVIRPDWRATS